MKQVPLFFAGCVGALCAGALLMHRVRSAETFPPFDEQHAPSWHAYGGDWSLDHGVYTNHTPGRGDKLVGGPQAFGNYSVSTDVRFDTASGDPSFGDAGVLLRVMDPGVGVDAHRGYYAALRLDDHALVIGAMAFQYRELATTSFPHELRTMHWYHLTFTAHECTFRVHAEDPDTKEAADLAYVEHACTPRQGQVGIRSYYARASWRDMQVVASR